MQGQLPGGKNIHRDKQQEDYRHIADKMWVLRQGGKFDHGEKKNRFHQ